MPFVRACVRLCMFLFESSTRLPLTNRATHLCKRNGVADLKHVPPHIGYHTEFGRFALKDVGINTELPNWGALQLHCLEMGDMADPKITSLPTCVTTLNLVVL